MKEKLSTPKKGLSTAAVFLTAISTILGAIMFLRFGFAVGNLGFLGTLSIILIGHMITIPTAMAISEIATNQKVEGGGEYYIISRSFGINIGGTIGIALFLSQAVSVAFYIIAFAQAFQPIIELLIKEYNILLDVKAITIPSTLILAFLMIKKGADLGVTVLYGVVFLLFISLVMFFLGSTDYSQTLESFNYNAKISTPLQFIAVFAICFPGFTGMTAGVGLSGDLKNPSKSIPQGTMLATIVGMLIYIAIIWKLSSSVSPEDLADPNNQMVMADIALWPPIIYIGLAAATVSSALGSFMVGPRTLQALGADGVFPINKINTFTAKGKKGSNEPTNATIVTTVIAILILLVGDVNSIAEIISMFFMLTYGALCLISFFEHFAADPSYRPSFKSKWYLSLIGAVGCFIIMFRMNAGYAILAFCLIAVIFIGISYSKKDKQGLARIFSGVIFQLSRRLQVFLQKSTSDSADSWRPSVICISNDSFERFAAFELLSWISRKYGFGTFIHTVTGYLSKETSKKSDEDKKRLVSISESIKSNVYIDTFVSPSITSTIAQIVQLPGVSGKENNTVLFEYAKSDPKNLIDIVDNYPLIKASEFDVLILGSSERSFGFKRSIHVWITGSDYDNANLMILLAYIIMGHPDWKKGSITIFAVYPEEQMQEQKDKLLSLIKSGRLPISKKNISVIPKSDDIELKSIINTRSKEADLTVVGFMDAALKHNGKEVFSGYDQLGDVLFVNTDKQKEII
ncbi:MAG: amino acid permease [Cyclobacteriaceae bacterium]